MDEPEMDGPRLPMTEPIHLRQVTVDVYRAPIETPVCTAFGCMFDRPAVVITARAADGTEGYGEIWCNFPTVGAHHRARLVSSFLAPGIVGREWPNPMAVSQHLEERVRVLALQAGEPGPLAQAIAGIDIALWDLAARWAGQPLWRLLGGSGEGTVPSYASGIGPERPLDQAVEARNHGHRAFKLKVGFDKESDLANLEAMRGALGEDAPIAVDANQAWGLDDALQMSAALAPVAPVWLEEPLAVDSPSQEWLHLAKTSPVALAGGENLRGRVAFDEAIELGALQVIQPDVAKWGGISGCLPLARRIMEAGRRYCPHYLGGGVGLLASAHLLAAVGGDGLLEIDTNPNPLRTGLAQPFPDLVDGRLVLSDAPGLGVAPDASMEAFRVLSETVGA